jgi:tRNA A-37 threonylcarbamoyl transferase component Bud32
MLTDVSVYRKNIMLTVQAFEALCQRPDLTPLESSKRGVKVFETQDGKILKIFRGKKNRLSSNHFKPYAVRFANNAKHLQQLGIMAPKVESVEACPDLNIHVLCYEKLPGKGAATLVREGNRQTLDEVIAFVAKLHQKGIFFRALHMSNLLRQSAADFALIDVADMRFRKNPLSLYMRLRNLKHLFMHRDDKIIWSQAGTHYWLKSYCEAAGFSSLKKYLVMLYEKLIGFKTR